MIEECFFCTAPECDICYLARKSCPNTTKVGNADASLGLDFDGMLSSYLVGIELSAEAERDEPEFDPW